MFRCLKANYITIYEILYHQTEIAHLRHLTVHTNQFTPRKKTSRTLFYIQVSCFKGFELLAFPFC